jgi:hypothetical protein
VTATRKGLRQARALDSTQKAGDCWICWRELTPYTDGEGRVAYGCKPCRREIERLQAFERRHTFTRILHNLDRVPSVAVGSRSGTGRRYHVCTRDELQRARFVAARYGLAAAARDTGIKYPTLYLRARKEHWPVRPMQGKRTT